jgi:hypothetical protein
VTKLLNVINAIGIMSLVAWLTVFVISFSMNYKFTSRDIVDDLKVITSDKSISKWIDIDETYVTQTDSLKTTYRFGFSFIPSENSIYIRMKNNIEYKNNGNTNRK